MEITVSKATGRVLVTIIHPTGNLDSTTSVPFKEKADELIRDGARFILVDFTDIPYISSAALRTLRSILSQLRKLHAAEKPGETEAYAGNNKSPHLKLLNLCPNVRSVFNICGFNIFFDDFTDLKQAIDSF